MNPVIAKALGQDAYDQLPEGVKMNFTRNQFMWLSDAEKANLVTRETECEYDE